MNEVPSGEQPASGGSTSPGAALLAERRRQNLSLGDVSRQLKLSVRQVEALERDDFSGFQGPVFVHGFIRNYAKLLALDPAPLIRAADGLLKPAAPQAPSEAPAPQAAAPAARRTGSKWPMAATVAVVVVGLGLLAVYPRGATKPKPVAEPAARIAAAPQEKRAAAAPKVLDKPAAEKPAAAKAAPEKSVPERPRAEKPADEKHGAEATAPAKTPDGEINTQAEEVRPSASAPSAIGTAEAGETGPRMTLRMIFDQDSWVEVKDRNGNTVFGQLNAAGTRRSASGEPPLSVVVGNAAGVRLYLGEKNIDLAPHTRVDVARLTVE